MDPMVEVTDEHSELSRAMGIKLDKRRKMWTIRSPEGKEEFFSFGAKVGVSAETALKRALGAAKRPQSHKNDVSTWTKKACDVYLKENGLPACKASMLQDTRREVVAWAMFRASKQAEKTSVSSGAASSSKPTVAGAASSGEVCSDKSSKLSGLPAPNAPKGAQKVEDITQNMFRRSEDQTKGPSEQVVPSEDACCTVVTEATGVLMPKVAIVKYLEAVNATAPEFPAGELRGQILEKGKYKNRMLVRSLFVEDPASESRVNHLENAEWSSANPTLSLAGRQAPA